MHNINYREFPENVDRKAVLNSIIKEAARDGDGYSGPMHWHDEIRPLEDRDAAEARIRQLDKGWYDDHAVRFYDFSGAKETKRMTELRERVRETCEKRFKYEKEHSVVAFKAEFVGCPKCGSKLARKFLRGDTCPVCRADMRSETTKQTIEGYKAKVDSLEKQLEEERRKQLAARKVMWLVKYEYHS